MTNTNRHYDSRASFDAARAALPSGPDQSKEWATLLKRTNPTFVAGLMAYIATIAQRKADYAFNANFPAYICCDDLQIEVGNTGGYVRIVEQKRVGARYHEEGSEGAVTGQRMSHSFVSMADAPATKAMAARKAGEIFKCATYKAPAKRARGSIFSATCGAEALSPSASIIYLA